MCWATGNVIERESMLEMSAAGSAMSFLENCVALSISLKSGGLYVNLYLLVQPPVGDKVSVRGDVGHENRGNFLNGYVIEGFFT